MAWRTFYTADDVNGTLELQYDPVRQQFKEIKRFEDPAYGTTTRVYLPDELPQHQQDAFDAAFPEEE